MPRLVSLLPFCCPVLKSWLGTVCGAWRNCESRHSGSTLREPSHRSCTDSGSAEISYDNLFCIQIFPAAGLPGDQSSTVRDSARAAAPVASDSVDTVDVEREPLTSAQLARIKDIELWVCQVSSAIYALFASAMAAGMAVNMAKWGLLSAANQYLTGIITCFVVLFILHPRDIDLILPGFIFFVMFPMSYVVLFLYAFLNVDTMKWGTRDAVEDNPFMIPKATDRHRQLPLQVCLGDPVEPLSSVVPPKLAKLVQHHVLRKPGDEVKAADALRRTVISRDLQKLRGSWLLVIFMVNAACLVGLFATSRLDVEHSNSAGVFFLIGCSAIILLQFACTLVHRLYTFVAYLAQPLEFERGVHDAVHKFGMAVSSR